MRTFKIALGAVLSAVGLYFAVWCLLNPEDAMPYPIYAAALIAVGVFLLVNGIRGNESMTRPAADVAAEMQQKREFAEKNHIPYKSKTTAVLLALFLGCLGIHRIYLGKNSGFVFLVITIFTFWSVFIPLIFELIALIDLITIARGEWQDKYYRDLI